MVCLVWLFVALSSEFSGGVFLVSCFLGLLLLFVVFCVVRVLRKRGECSVNTRVSADFSF
jgi:hypothetical protein